MYYGLKFFKAFMEYDKWQLEKRQKVKQTHIGKEKL